MSKQRKDHDLDDFDDFDLDGEFDFGGEAGFEAEASPKGRNPVTRFIGSFKDGVKETLFKKETAKKMIEEALPQSYTVAIDGALDVASDARDTADKLKRETSKNINDIKVANRDELNAFADALPKGFGDKMKKWVATGKPSDVANVDQDQLALASSLAQVFGEAQNAQANQQQKETMSKLTDATASQNQMLANVNDVLFGIHKSVDRMVTYQDSIGVNFQRKMLETSLQQLFVSRKHLERVEKHYAFIEKAVPDIVQNTGLPDFVKINKAEMVQKEMASRFVGQMSDRLYASTAQIRQQVFRKLQGSLKEASQQLTGAAGMVASNASLFLGAGLDGGPVDMVSQAGKMAGGYLAGKASEYAAKELKAMIKKNPELAKRVDDGDAFLQMLRARAPGYLNSKGLRGNTGNKYIDGAINYLGLDELSLRRNRTISKSLNGHLEDAAIFNLRTQRAITEVIPGLLSRIHLELHKANGGKETSPLQYDWSKGGFTTRKKYTDDLIKTRVATLSNARELNDFETNFSKSFDPDNKLAGELKSKISRQMVLAGINGDDVSITEMIDPGNKNYIPALAKHIKAEFGVEFEKGMSQDQRKAVMEMFKGGQKLMKLETELNNSRNRVAQQFKDPKGELLKLVAGEDISDFDQYSFIKKKSDGSLEFDYEAYFDYQRNNHAQGLGRDAYKKVGLRQINPYRVFSPGVTGARWDYAGRNQFGVQNRTAAVYSAPALARQAQSMNDPLVMPEDMQMQVNGVSMATVAPIANAIQRGFNRVFGEDEGVDSQGKPLSKRQQKRLAKAQGGLVGSMAGTERYLKTLVDNNKTQLDQLHDDLGEVVKAIQEIQVLSTVDPADRPGFISKLADKAKSGGKKAWSFTKGYYNKMWGLTKWVGGKAKGVAGWGWDLAKKIPGLSLLGKLKDGVVGGAKGLAGLTATYYKTLFNLGIGSEEDPGLMRKAWRGGKKLINRFKNGAMSWKLGIYLEGEEFPRLDMIGLKMGKFRDEQTGKVIKKLSDISGGNIIDAEGNVVISAEQIKNGLYNKFGERIDSKLKIGRGKLRDVLGFVWNVNKALLKMPFKAIGWGLDKIRSAKIRLAKFAEDKNWGELLKFGSFSNSSRQLEETIKIRELLEKRLNPEAHWADEDGDGDRDGSYKDLMQRKAEAKDDKATEEKPKEEKKEKKESWFSRLLGGLGGLVGRLGPMIMAGVGMAAKLAIPALIAGWAIPKVFNWFKDDPIDPNDPRLDPNSPQYDPKLDPNSPEYSPSLSHRFGTWAEDKWNNAGLGTKAAVAGAAGLAMMHPIRTAKGVGWLGKKAWGAGKWAFDKWSDWRTAKGAVDAVKTAKNVATAANTAKNVATAANVASKVGTVAKVARGIRAAQGLAYLAGGAGKVALGSAVAGGKAALVAGLGAAKAAGAALMASPAAPFVIGAIAIGAVAYGGYKLWERSKKRSESPMARLRMAGYGYEITDGDHVPKLMEVESILGRSLRKKNDGSYTVSDDVQRETILKIFNVAANDATAVQKWEKYFFYRFLPVYLSFVNALAKNNFSVDVTTMDDNLTYPQQRVIASDSIVTAEGLDPYSVMESGFGGERKVDLDREEVFDIYNSVGKLLDKNIRRGEANKRVKNRTAENEKLDKELTKDEKKIKEALKKTGQGDTSVEDLPVQSKGFGSSISRLIGGVKDAVKGAWDGIKSGFSWLGDKLGFGGSSSVQSNAGASSSLLDRMLGRNTSSNSAPAPTPTATGTVSSSSGSVSTDYTGGGGDYLMAGTGGTVANVAKSKGNGWANNKDTIISAAKIVGVDPGIAAFMAAQESAFKPRVKNPNSSASGLFQFISSTWNSMVSKYGAKYGIPKGTSVLHPEANALLGMQFTKDNIEQLKSVLGNNIQPGDVYLAHFLGIGGARKALRAGDSALAGPIVGAKVVSANKTIFPSGQTIGGMRRKLTELMLASGRRLGVDIPIGGGGGGTGVANVSSSGTGTSSGASTKVPANTGKVTIQTSGKIDGKGFGAGHKWEGATYGQTSSSKGRSNASSYVFMGDSIANGFATAYGASTTYTKVGSSADHHAKNYIPVLLNNVSAYRKKFVILSMFTNNPTKSNLNHILTTLVTLKRAGLTVNMLGVVSSYTWGYKWPNGWFGGRTIKGTDANAWLKEQCVNIGHRFLGGFSTSDKLGYHPASYSNLPGSPVTGGTAIHGKQADPSNPNVGKSSNNRTKSSLVAHYDNQTAMANKALSSGFVASNTDKSKAGILSNSLSSTQPALSNSVAANNNGGATSSWETSSEGGVYSSAQGNYSKAAYDKAKVKHFQFRQAPRSLLVKYNSSSEEKFLIHKAALDPLRRMVAASKGKLSVGSIFRSINRQRTLTNSALSSRGASAYKTRPHPGFSEHHTGLAVDFNPINHTFAKTAGYSWLLQHAAEYGFVQTFTAEYSRQTGVEEESWHWKYVGSAEARQALTPVGAKNVIGAGAAHGKMDASKAAPTSGFGHAFSAQSGSSNTTGGGSSVANSGSPSTGADTTSASTIPGDAKPAKMAAFARKNAHSTTKHRCSEYVRKAIQSEWPNYVHPKSAYQNHENKGNFNAIGFVQIDISTPWQVGDIIVTNKVGGNVHGHIQIWDGQNWISDFIQKSGVVTYGKKAKLSMWRHKDYLNGASEIDHQWQDCDKLGVAGAVTSLTANDTSVAGAGAPRKKWKHRAVTDAGVLHGIRAAKEGSDGGEVDSKPDNGKSTPTTNDPKKKDDKKTDPKKDQKDGDKKGDTKQTGKNDQAKAAEKVDKAKADPKATSKLIASNPLFGSFAPTGASMFASSLTADGRFEMSDVATGTVSKTTTVTNNSQPRLLTLDDVLDGSKVISSNPALAKQQTEVAVKVAQQRVNEYNQRVQLAKQEEITKQSEYDRSILNKQLVVQQDMLMELKGIRDEIKYLKVGGGMNPTISASQLQQPKTEPVRPSAPDTVLEPVSMGKL